MSRIKRLEADERLLRGAFLGSALRPALNARHQPRRHTITLQPGFVKNKRLFVSPNNVPILRGVVVVVVVVFTL